MNYSDSARIKAVLTNCGLAYVDNKEQADIVILDTCSVRQKSEDKVRWQLKELRQEQKVRLTGCMIQHNLNLKKTRTTKSKKYKQGNFTGDVMSNEPFIVGLESLEDDAKLKEIVREYALGRENRTDEILYVNHAFDPLFNKMNDSFSNVELFFRIDDVGFLPFVMKKLWYEVNPDVDVVNEYTGIIPHNANMLFKENTKTAYVPISTGCSQFCAYCIVPYARWLEKNRAVDEVITEVKHHVEQWAEEIVLLGQIVNKHPDFYSILKQVTEIPWVKWVRYTSPYPTYYSDEIFALHQDKENLCPHIHMPLQAWSDAVLKKMFRGYTSDQFREFVDKVRQWSRPISITSDVIVWFCDETEEDFVETLELCEYSRFDMIYIGIYSPRPGTYGARKYDDNVPLKEKKQRRSRLNDVLTKVSTENNKLEEWTSREIIVKQIQDRAIIGYSDNMKNVIIEADDEISFEGVQKGDFLRTKILRTEPFKLYGTWINN